MGESAGGGSFCADGAGAATARGDNRQQSGREKKGMPARAGPPSNRNLAPRLNRGQALAQGAQRGRKRGREGPRGREDEEEKRGGEGNRDTFLRKRGAMLRGAGASNEAANAGRNLPFCVVFVGFLSGLRESQSCVREDGERGEAFYAKI